MSHLARCLSVLVGLVFAVSAGAKAVDYYGFIERAAYYRSFDYATLHFGAWTTILIEAGLAALFLSGAWLRRLAIPAAGLLILVLSGLIVHAWVTFGIDDCACLGSLAETPPQLALVKNGVILAILAWLGLSRVRLPRPSTRRSGLAALLLVAGLGSTTIGILSQTHDWPF